MAASALTLAACSVQLPTLAEDPTRELTQVPFFPQTLHQCGPAALATVLGWSGVHATPEALDCRRCTSPVVQAVSPWN